MPRLHLELYIYWKIQIIYPFIILYISLYLDKQSGSLEYSLTMKAIFRDKPHILLTWFPVVLITQLFTPNSPDSA